MEIKKQEKKVKISASIMCGNWMHLENDLRILEKHNIDYIHFDVMDGFFCPDYCLGTQIINVLRANTQIPGDFHLMVEEPSRILDNFVAKKGDILSIHYEACRNLHRDIMRIKKAGFKAGVVLNPATPVNAIEYIIEEVDVVGIMTVNPGYAGQKLVPQALKKIEVFDRLRKENNLSFEISVDGNVNSQNIPLMVAGGADVLIGGSSGLFINGQPLEDSIVNFRDLINKGFIHGH